MTSVLRHRFQRASEGFCLVLPDLSGKKKRSGRRKKNPPGFDVHLVPADVTAAGVQGDSGVCPGASLDGSRQVAIPPPICQLVRRRHVGSRHRPYAQIATASKCHLFSGGCTAGGVGWRGGGASCSWYKWPLWHMGHMASCSPERRFTNKARKSLKVAGDLCQPFIKPALHVGIFWSQRSRRNISPNRLDVFCKTIWEKSSRKMYKIEQTNTNKTKRPSMASEVM